MSQFVDTQGAMSAMLYYDHFQYPPTHEELCQFAHHFDRGKFERHVRKLVQEGLILKRTFREVRLVEGRETDVVCARYALRGKMYVFHDIESRHQEAIKKLKRIEKYMRILALFPQIVMAGVSGSVSMYVARELDDIDVFIITRKGSLWIGRVIAICVAEFLRMRRRRTDVHVQDKVCLNLFFDQCDMMIPPHKHNVYVAHELVQMKPAFSRSDAYNTLLCTNRWVLSLFPQSIRNRLLGKKSRVLFLVPSAWRFLHILSVINGLCGYIQRIFIERHKKGSEYITSTQLWFFPRDNQPHIMSSIEREL